MIRIKMEVEGSPRQMRLKGTAVVWPEGVRRANPECKATAGTNVLLVFLARYKLWGLESKQARFEISGDKHSVAGKIRNLLDNCHKSGHWCRKVFGPKLGNPQRCRLVELVAAPERDGRFTAYVRHASLPPESVEIVWNRDPVSTEQRLQRFLSALQAPDDDDSTWEPAISPSDSTAATEISIDQFDVRVWSATEKPRRNVSVREAGALPLRSSDLIRIFAEFSRPVYPYLLWIDNAGEPQFLYPWQERSWENRPADESMIRAIELPEYSTQLGLHGFPVEGPSGMETVILAVREDRLPEDCPLAEHVRGFPQDSVPYDETKPIEFACTEAERLAQDEYLGLGSPQPIDDPVSEITQFVRDRLGGHFTAVRGLCLPKRA